VDTSKVTLDLLEPEVKPWTTYYNPIIPVILVEMDGVFLILTKYQLLIALFNLANPGEFHLEW